MPQRDSDLESTPVKPEGIVPFLLQLGIEDDQPALCRSAVAGMSAVCEVDRAGLWLLSESRTTVVGTFGIDERGRLRDEREALFRVSPDCSEEIPDHPKLALLLELISESGKALFPSYRRFEGDLSNHQNRSVGRGEGIVVTVWSGRRVRGFLFADNLFGVRRFSESSIQRILLVATGIGQNLDRIDALGQWKRTAGKLERERNLAHTITDSVGEVVFARDREGRYLYANSAWRNLNPRAKVWPIVGRRLDEVFDEPLTGERLERDRRIFETGESLVETYTIRPRGDERMIESKSYPVFDKEGEVTAAAYILRDITEDHRRWEELEAQKRVAEQALQARNRYIAVMNHELRSPLHTILGPLEYLKESALDGEDAEMVAIALESGRHMTAIIDNILDMARLERGRMPVNKVPVALQDFLGTRLQPFGNMAEGKGLYFRTCVAAEVPDTVALDPELLARILINLISNAIKFTVEGGIDLRIFIKNEEIVFEVSDTGPGIPEEDQHRLFRPFEQIEKTNPGNKGSGLGLAICKDLAGLMGGELDVRSRPGEGTAFCLRLPCGPVESGSPV